MGAQDQQHTAFPLARRREPGYRADQVDEFLERARNSYEGLAPEGETLTAAEVRSTAFGMRRGGYGTRYVDSALDRLEDVFFERERRANIRRGDDEAWWDDTRQLLSEVRGRLTRPPGKRFRRRGILATGYRRSEVDAFFDGVAAALEDRSFGYTPTEVREIVFHSQWRGYDEGQIDALLDAIVELILSTR